MTIIRITPERKSDYYECFDCQTIFVASFTMDKCTDCDSDNIYRMK